jgi:hypothetical protein
MITFSDNITGGIMKCILSKDRKSILIREVVNHVYVERVIYDLNPILLSKGYNPIYYFEGSPQISEGGLSVSIKLSKELTSEDWLFVKRLVELTGFKAIEGG